jgi:hypothetical protein
MASHNFVDSPSPFAPIKELQDFLRQWEDHPQAQTDYVLQLQLQQTREALPRRKATS